MLSSFFCVIRYFYKDKYSFCAGGGSSRSLRSLRMTVVKRKVCGKFNYNELFNSYDVILRERRSATVRIPLIKQVKLSLYFHTYFRRKVSPFFIHAFNQRDFLFPLVFLYLFFAFDSQLDFAENLKVY